MTSSRQRGSLGRALFDMTWPMIFGVVSLMSFQLVDSIFISMLGVEPLAALGFTVPVNQLFIAIQVGIGIAATALISRALGAGNPERAKRLGGLVIAIGWVAMLTLCVLVWVVRRPLLTALGADPALLPMIGQYWLPWLGSAWVGAMLYFAYSICRANGDTRLPGLMMVVTSLLNLALDPLFIFVFGWGLPGAALATLTAFGLGAAVTFMRLQRRAWLRLDPHGLPPLPALRQLAGISLPAMVSQLMPAVSALLATNLVAGFGAGAVAAWALGTRLEYFSIVTVLALTMSLPPMVGRFLGAGQLKRIRSLIKIAARFVLGLQLIIALAWMAGSGMLPGLLAPEPEVAELLHAYLLLVPLSYGPLGVCMIMVSVCNALGLPARAVLISFIRLFVCYLPGLWLGARLGGMPGLYAGALAGNLAAGAISWLLYNQAIERLQGSAPGLARSARQQA